MLSGRFASLLSALAVLACARATPVSEKVAAVASARYAATVASARAAAAGVVPLGERAAVTTTSFAPAAGPECARAPSDACGLDLVDDEPVPDLIVVGRKAPVRLIGWAADGAARTVPPIVVVELSGETTYDAPAARLTRRPDVARALKIPEFAASGYDVMGDFHDVAPGRYRLRVNQVTSGGGALGCDTRRVVVVE